MQHSRSASLHAHAALSGRPALILNQYTTETFPMRVFLRKDDAWTLTWLHLPAGSFDKAADRLTEGAENRLLTFLVICFQRPFLR